MWLEERTIEGAARSLLVADNHAKARRTQIRGVRQQARDQQRKGLQMLQVRWHEEQYFPAHAWRCRAEVLALVERDWPVER